jgi:cbb3-type cytochrome oxidase cytochrome c subunit
LVNEPSTRPVAAWIYPAAVSLYSTALVAWPGWFSGLKSDARAIAWRAACLFSIAGWFGSANGIGMVQTLSRVPSGFVAAAGVAVVSALVLADVGRWRIWLMLAATGAVSWIFGGVRVSPVLSEAERGRLVYVSEGCLHCHSQYVRPGSPDERVWGGTRGLDKVVGEQPVLIGNRRQGPDLTNIGSRRSTAWLKAHFIEPRTLVPHSAMPSYAHLFGDPRGDDLVRYLSESGRDRIEEVRKTAASWTPGPVTVREDGKALFSSHCVACHGATGMGDGPLAKQFSKSPANLVKGPFLSTPAGDDLGTRVARVIKFGLPGTDMPGHEVMTDAQIMALKEEVLILRGSIMLRTSASSPPR